MTLLYIRCRHDPALLAPEGLHSPYGIQFEITPEQENRASLLRQSIRRKQQTTRARALLDRLTFARLLGEREIGFDATDIWRHVTDLNTTPQFRIEALLSAEEVSEWLTRICEERELSGEILVNLAELGLAPWMAIHSTLAAGVWLTELRALLTEQSLNFDLILLNSEVTHSLVITEEEHDIEAFLLDTPRFSVT